MTLVPDLSIHDALCIQELDTLCYDDGNAPSALYSSPMLRLKVQQGRFANHVNLSFCVTAGHVPLAYCLLFAHAHEQHTQLACLDVAATCWYVRPLPPEHMYRVDTALKKHWKNLLDRYTHPRVAFTDYYAEQRLSSCAEMLLQRPAAQAHVCHTHMVPLQEGKIHMRKRYLTLIAKVQRAYTFTVYTASTIQRAHIDALHHCHKQASGRDVYPDAEFWNIFYEMIRKDTASLVLARNAADMVVGALLTVHSSSRAYYAVGAFDRSAENSSVSHGCMYTAMTHARHCGFTYYETGRTDFAALRPDISDKEMGIGFFKRGFGGVNSPLLIITA